MKYRVIGRVAHFHNGAVLGLSADQFAARAHQLEHLGKGTFRVTGPHVCFKYSEIIDVIDAVTADKASVLEALGRADPTPAPTDDLKSEADALGVRYGLGVPGAKLKEEIAKIRSDIATDIKVQAADKIKAADARKKARAARSKKK